MSDLNGIKPRVCGDCRHWHKQPPNLGNLGAPPQGQCRFNPPTATTIMANGDGQTLHLVACNYPRLPENYPACSHHAARLALTEIH